MFSRFRCCFLFLFTSFTLQTFAHSPDTTRWASSAIRLNTDAAESHPMLSADGQTLYFVRSNHEQNIGEENKADIWVSYRDSTGTWSNSVNVGAPLNNDNENKVVGINLSSETLYLTGDANNEIFYAKYKNRTWGFPRALEISGIANQSSTLNCHVSLDERYIIFALSNDSCVGKRDLFMSYKNASGKWVAPRSLGALLNTAGDEANVFLAADNRTLYFSSDGRDGLGGLDWYVTRRLDDDWLNWSQPKNLGEAVNSSKDDLYFCINTELEECYGIRQNSALDTDIARFVIKDASLLPVKTVLIYGKVSLPNGEPIQTLVEVQQLSKEEIDNTVSSKSDGSFQVLLTQNDKIGFYALDKASFSSLAYVNLTENPLKILDADTSSNANIFRRDSVHLYNSEKLQIRLTQLNERITDLDKNRPKAKNLEYQALLALLKNTNSFEVNQNLDKQRLFYNEKYRKEYTSTASVDDIPKSYEISTEVPSVDDNFYTTDTLNRVALMKKGFDEKKKLKETPKPNAPEELKPAPVSKEEERRAIEEIGELHGVESQNAPDFEVLIEGVARKIIRSSMIDIREDLQREFIEEWNNWGKLAYSDEEERKINPKLTDVKKRLKQYFEEKNALELLRNGTAISYNEDEKGIAKQLRNSVTNGLRSYLKEEVLQEIDFEMVFRLHNELRTILYKALEKEKNNLQKNAHNNKEQKVNHDDERAENEQKTHLDLVVYPLKTNVVIPLRGIYFSPNSAEVLPESNAELSRIKQIFDEDPFRVIELSAHTHGYCNADFANNITHQRLQNIKRILMEKGVSENHIWLRPYGKNAPLAPNNTLEGRLLNQRIEMKLVVR